MQFFEERRNNICAESLFDVREPSHTQGNRNAAPARASFSSISESAQGTIPRGSISLTRCSLFYDTTILKSIDPLPNRKSKAMIDLH